MFVKRNSQLGIAPLIAYIILQHLAYRTYARCHSGEESDDDSSPDLIGVARMTLQQPAHNITE